MRDSKDQLRASIRAQRRGRSAAERDSERAGLTSELRKLVLKTGARRILAFLPTDTEPPLAEFLELAHHDGVVILTPRAHDNATMTWVVYHPDHDQVRSHLGVPEIVDGAALDSADALSQADLVLVPAAAVDTHGTRLGWGKGFYDRALEQSAHSVPIYAVVFDDEVMGTLPREEHDQPVAGVVTPHRTLTFS